MNQFDRIQLKNANKNGRPIWLIIGTIAGYEYSDVTKCTQVYTTAGVFPAQETPDEINQLIDQLLTKGVVNGQSK